MLQNIECIRHIGYATHLCKIKEPIGSYVSQYRITDNDRVHLVYGMSDKFVPRMLSAVINHYAAIGQPVGANLFAAMTIQAKKQMTTVRYMFHVMRETMPIEYARYKDELAKYLMLM